MAIAMKLKDYLDHMDVNYELVEHPYTATAMEAAEQSHVSGEKIAKAVLLQDADGYVLAVLPATHKVQIQRLGMRLNRPLELAEEPEIGLIFDDCDLGALPPVGKAYKMDVVLDDALDRSEDLYFEAGDHTSLVHMRTRDFHALLGDAPHGEFSRHM